MATTGSTISLLEHFSALADPRQAWKVVYLLPEILLLVLAATLAGADDFVEARLWGQAQLPFLRRFLAFRHGIPSHDTLERRDQRARPRTVQDLLRHPADASGVGPCGNGAASAAGSSNCASASPTSWRSMARPRAAATRGPRGASRCIWSRPSGAAGAGCSAVGSAKGRWASRQRLVLGQEAVAGKSNEIKAIPLLLERLALTGALVTIDAIGCQTKIARAIRAKGANYLLAVKTNWPALHAEIACYFADVPAAADRLETTDGDHGRIEIRRHVVTRDIGWLATDRRFPGEPRFPGLATIAMVEAEVERAGQTTIARRYYLSSAQLDAATFARAVPAHWGIENRLHWVLDVVFHDDLARLRTGHGPENMVIVKHMAMNLVRQAQPITSLKNRRKKAAWNPDYLETLLRQTA